MPQQYSKNKSLGEWASIQRYYYKCVKEGKPSPLTKERINSLNKVGFVWQLPEGTRKANYRHVKYSNETYTTSNNEVSVVSSASASASASLKEKENDSSVATVDCTKLAVTEGEEDGYESNDSEWCLVI